MRSFNLCLIVTSVWVYPFILVFHHHLRSQGCQKGKVTQSIFLTSFFLVKLELVMWNAWAVMHLTAFCTVGAFLKQVKKKNWHLRDYVSWIVWTLHEDDLHYSYTFTPVSMGLLNFSVIVWSERVNCLWSLYIEIRMTFPIVSDRNPLLT